MRPSLVFICPVDDFVVDHGLKQTVSFNCFYRSNVILYLRLSLLLVELVATADDKLEDVDDDGGVGKMSQNFEKSL